MTLQRGVIALMGSGELTATMVEVHKQLLARMDGSPRAVFIDTPAGFQSNCDHLSQRAVDYFRTNIGHQMSVVSFKSKSIPSLEAEQAFRGLRDSDYVLVGPGSPTYALRQWRDTPIPGILEKRIEQGACFVAASAAALTIGRFTIPVYEIYKVGQDPHWVDGLDILGHLGLNIVVVPHWNNAEGGTHDTRFCFMGEDRFKLMEAMLPEDAGVLGIDEHTACIIDLGRQEFSVKGVGKATLRYRTFERTFMREEVVPLAALSESQGSAGSVVRFEQAGGAKPESDTEESRFWDSVHALETEFRKGLERDTRDAANALLDLEGAIWQAGQDELDPQAVSQSRELLRECIVLLGTRLASARGNLGGCIESLVEELLSLRASFRKNDKWSEADEIRDCLRKINVEVEDTPEGYRWRLEK